MGTEGQIFLGRKDKLFLPAMQINVAKGGRGCEGGAVPGVGRAKDETRTQSHRNLLLGVSDTYHIDAIINCQNCNDLSQVHTCCRSSCKYKERRVPQSKVNILDPFPCN